MTNKQPIGVFDSGLGGLTVVKQLRRLLPNEDIVYFGDTARVPYGTRAVDTIVRYAKQDIRFLLSQEVKMIVCACGTVSSTLPKEFTDSLGIPFVGVVEHTAKAAAEKTHNGKIGVIGTTATIRSGSFEQALREMNPALHVIANDCPLFVPLVENGYVNRDNAITKLVVKEYLQPILSQGVDTLILGCTHYPLLKEIIADAAGESVALVDSGIPTALYLKQYLLDTEAANDPTHEGTARFCVSSSYGFSEQASRFLKQDVTEAVEQVNIDSF